jgi:murein DD-endopeptidase MepM/ murein hydrolase activator NlpD
MRSPIRTMVTTARTRAADLSSAARQRTRTFGASAAKRGTAIRDYTGSIVAFAVEGMGGRAPAAALLTAGLFTGGMVLGVSALGNDPASAVGYKNATAMSDEERLRAEQRADRFGRGSPADTAAEAKTAAAAKATADAKAIAAANAAAVAKAAAAKRAAAAKKAPAWVLPLKAPLTSCFGPRWGSQHQGIDIAGPAGAKIASVGAGTVVGAGWLRSGYGISVLVDHGKGYLSHYAHASKVLVKKGQRVKPGTPLALEGSTGDSTGPHLHFEIHQGPWNQVNPAIWLRARGVKIGC